MTAVAEVSGDEAHFSSIEDILKDFLCANLIVHAQKDSDTLAGKVFRMFEQL